MFYFTNLIYNSKHAVGPTRKVRSESY